MLTTHHNPEPLFCILLIISWHFATRAWPYFGGIFGIATANPYIRVPLAASPTEQGLCDCWADGQLLGVSSGEIRLWLKTYSVHIIYTAVRCTRDGGEELSRAVVAGCLSATEHWSDEGATRSGEIGGIVPLLPLVSDTFFGEALEEEEVLTNQGKGKDWQWFLVKRIVQYLEHLWTVSTLKIPMRSLTRLSYAQVPSKPSS